MKKFKKLYIEDIDIASGSYNLACVALLVFRAEAQRSIDPCVPVSNPTVGRGCRVTVGVTRKRTPLLKAMSAKHRSKFAALSPPDS